MRVAMGGAWLFALGSAVALGLTAWMMWPGPGSVADIMSADVPDGGTVAWPGLRYAGTAGLALLLAELAVVVAAVVGSVLPWSRPRRVGHAVLVAWAAWWMAGGVYAWSWERGFWMALLVAVLGFMLACTIVRAARGWRGRRGRRPISARPAKGPLPAGGAAG